MLGYARRLDARRLLQRARRAALAAAQRAARRSPAYRTLLAEAGLAGVAIGAGLPLEALPVLDKASTFERFGLAELSGALDVHALADVLTSSGHGGDCFAFSLGLRRAQAAAVRAIDLGLQDAFGVDDCPTLLVNCLPMGVVFRSAAVTVANVSVREDMACAILRELGPRFGQCIVCTDPLFANRLLDHAQDSGVDWPALQASLIIGEEPLAESQRQHLAQRLGLDPDRDERRLVASSFGVGELGLNLLFETRESLRLRRALRVLPGLQRQWLGRPAALALPMLMCFNPLRCHVEVLQPDAQGFGRLAFTMLDRHAAITLPRYATGDLGRLLPADEVQDAAAQAGLPVPWLPMVALLGRARDRAAGLPTVDEVKEALYAEPGLPGLLTGAFRLGRADDGAVRLRLQARPGVHAAEQVAPQLAPLREALRAEGRVLQVQWLDAMAFPARPVLDYERKFHYLDAAD